MRTAITRDEILSLEAYEAVRAERRRDVAALKRNRRVHVGPDVTFYFENYDTMLHQIHEMLRIEKGGEEQIVDELRAYNPLVPNGRSLVATMMIEVEDPQRRDRLLSALGNVEKTVSLEMDGLRIVAEAEGDEERTREDGKTSSVHFLIFRFTEAAIAAFRSPGARVVLSIRHPSYDHMAALPEAVRAALAGDFA